jgi:hypothetical protein
MIRLEGRERKGLKGVGWDFSAKTLDGIAFMLDGIGYSKE